MKRENAVFLVIGLAAGFLFTMSSYDLIEAAIPPTNALSRLFVQTSPWAGQDTIIQSNSYNDLWYLVSDGSVTFNVTSTPPP